MISIAEYAARRERVLAALNGAAGVVFAGDGHAPLLGKWRPNNHFYWLTGIDNEPGAAVVFDPSAPDPEKRITLLLRPLNPEADVWDGFREPLGAALKSHYGFTSVGRIGGLAGSLTSAARRTKRLACLHPFATYPAAVSSDLAAFRQVSERVLGVSVEDQTLLLPRLRAAKSPAELALMRRAVAATVDGYAAALAATRPGGSEEEVADALTTAFKAHGGVHAYNPIVGSGRNATVFHYMDNNGPLNAGELLLIDAGAAIGGYAADVTRTFPVSGTFTPEQRDLYNLVLEAMEAAIAVLKPGVQMWEADKAARQVFAKAGHPDAYPYSVGHGLGLDVHEAVDESGLTEGTVVTIEPGVYFADKGIGIRIEDDLLITATGCENLTAAIPKTVEALEAALAR